MATLSSRRAAACNRRVLLQLGLAGAAGIALSERLSAADPPDYSGVQLNVLDLEAPSHDVLAKAGEAFLEETGGAIRLTTVPADGLLPRLITNANSGDRQFDSAVIAAWWLGELVANELVSAWDQYEEPYFLRARVAEGEFASVAASRAWNGQRYLFPLNSDCQLLFARGDLLPSSADSEQFRSENAFDLGMPSTLDELLAVASYFQQSGEIEGFAYGWRLGGQLPYLFESLAAPYVIGPANPQNFWFHPETMVPLINSEGHTQGLGAMRLLQQVSPPQSVAWSQGESMLAFLDGRTVFTIASAELLSTAIRHESPVLESIIVAPLSGTESYIDPITGSSAQSDAANLVGNAIGPNWGATLAASSQYPEAVCYFWAIVAERSRLNSVAIRYDDGIHQTRPDQLPGDAGAVGEIALQEYLDQGWPQSGITSLADALKVTGNDAVQLPILRIPGADAYRQILDVEIDRYLRGDARSAQEALDSAAASFEEVTELHGREEQAERYRQSLPAQA